MKYVTYLNEVFKDQICKFGEFVLYGQNVSTGSCLGGLTRGLKELNGCNVFDTPNTENALVGLGFGLMLSGTPSALFLKQQDFLLLGIDHLRNTNNFIRQQAPSTSFTVVNIVMDAGYEGIQSSLNNLSDFCAIAGCQGYTISSKQEADRIIEQCFFGSGFRIISVSQRLFGTAILDLQHRMSQRDTFVMNYRQGGDLTIACFNFALPQGEALCYQLKELGIDSSLYSVTAAHPVSYKSIVEDARRTGRLVIIDDSKCCTSVSTRLEIESLRSGVGITYVAKREMNEQSYRPLPEVFTVNVSDILRQLNLSI
jgi:pyruvate/2-oxoglutarate/acetoin dehydrogenase E1 component